MTPRTPSRRRYVVVLAVVVVATLVLAASSWDRGGNDGPIAEGALTTTIALEGGMARLHPPGDYEDGIVSPSEAYERGYAKGPFSGGVPPDRVVLARFTDDAYGKVTATDRPATREGMQPLDAPSRIGAEGAVVDRDYVDTLVWAFLSDNRDYGFHGSAAKAFVAVIVDARSGEYLRAFASSV